MVYRGDMHTSNWEWLNDDEVAVYTGCGTACRSVQVIDTTTGETEAEFMNGSDYEWSPNGMYVAAYASWSRYGVTIADKQGNTLIALLRERDEGVTSPLTEATKVVWWDHQEKFAVFIKKEGKEEMEMLLDDREGNGFKQVGRY